MSPHDASIFLRKYVQSSKLPGMSPRLLGNNLVGSAADFNRIFQYENRQDFIKKNTFATILLNEKIAVT